MKKETRGIFAAAGIGIAAAILIVFSGRLLLYLTDYLYWGTFAVGAAAGTALAALMNFLRKKLRGRSDLKTLTFLVFANVPSIIACTVLWVIADFAERGEGMFAGLGEVLIAFFASIVFALCLVGEFVCIGIESFNRKRNGERYGSRE